jgi:hypothetical protein
MKKAAGSVTPAGLVSAKKLNLWNRCKGEKMSEPKPKEVPKETPTNTEKHVELIESSATKLQSGDQGISLKPMGSHDTDPFVSQDIRPALPSQVSGVQNNPPPPVQSTKNSNDD